MEYLDVVDEKGIHTGRTVERKEAHKYGILHRTAHVWLFVKGEDGIEVMLQKRSENKDSNPGCYDISSAGHIPAGDDYIPSAIREAEEELGICLLAEEFLYCGQRRIHYCETFHGEVFQDNQVSNVYAVWLKEYPDKLCLQEKEVAEVLFVKWKDLLQMVEENSIKHCIAKEELEILEKALCLSSLE